MCFNMAEYSKRNMEEIIFLSSYETFLTNVPSLIKFEFNILISLQ